MRRALHHLVGTTPDAQGLRLADKLFSEIRVRNVDERLCLLPGRLCLQLRATKLGHNGVDDQARAGEMVPADCVGTIREPMVPSFFLKVELMQMRPLPPSDR